MFIERYHIEDNAFTKPAEEETEQNKSPSEWMEENIDNLEPYEGEEAGEYTSFINRSTCVSGRFY